MRLDMRQSSALSSLEWMQKKRGVGKGYQLLRKSKVFSAHSAAANYEEIS